MSKHVLVPIDEIQCGQNRPDEKTEAEDQTKLCC